MKTEVKHEYGDWIVFVDGNPQFSFMYREEAEKVRNMVYALILSEYKLKDIFERMETESKNDPELTLIYRVWDACNKSLKDIGAI